MKKHYYTNDILSICDGHHLTVDEIFEQVQKKFPEAGKSTIYRNVEQLAKKGELTKVSGIAKKILFEKSKENHAHFICSDSGKVIDIQLNNIPEISRKNFLEKIQASQSNILSVDNLDIKIYGKLSA